MIVGADNIYRKKIPLKGGNKFIDLTSQIESQFLEESEGFVENLNFTNVTFTPCSNYEIRWSPLMKYFLVFNHSTKEQSFFSCSHYFNKVEVSQMNQLVLFYDD